MSKGRDVTGAGTWKSWSNEEPGYRLSLTGNDRDLPLIDRIIATWGWLVGKPRLLSPENPTPLWLYGEGEIQIENE